MWYLIKYGRTQTFPILGWLHWRWSGLFAYLPSSQFRVSSHNFLLWASSSGRKVSALTTDLDYYWRNSKKCRIWIGYRWYWRCWRNSSLMNKWRICNLCHLIYLIKTCPYLIKSVTSTARKILKHYK